MKNTFKTSFNKKKQKELTFNINFKTSLNLKETRK